MVKNMSYKVYREGDYTVVCLDGEVDLSCSPIARKTILDNIQKRDNLLVDLSSVEYIDSSGIASLVEGYQVSRSLGVKFALVGVSEAAMNVLRLARLDEVFPILASTQEAQAKA
jgi:anti-sigma B factor antagonist